jgi:acetyltransferase-like isoleucine patch superfamily enzyme
MIVKKHKVVSIIKKIWKRRSDFRSIFSSILFNFYYLPFKQAMYLPILLYKPKFISLKGNVFLSEDSNIRFGMIRLGFPSVSIYPNSGIIFDNRGTILFNGNCFIGNNSAISIAESGNVRLGDNFRASTTFKLVCYYDINIEENVLLGWDCIIMDTDFHKLTKLSGGYSKGYGSINIGNNCWIANSCKVLKKTRIPNYSVVTAGSIISGPIDFPEYSIIGSKQKMDVIASGLYHDYFNDIIEYKE